VVVLSTCDLHWYMGIRSEDYGLSGDGEGYKDVRLQLSCRLNFGSSNEAPATRRPVINEDSVQVNHLDNSPKVCLTRPLFILNSSLVYHKTRCLQARQLASCIRSQTKLNRVNNTHREKVQLLTNTKSLSQT